MSSEIVENSLNSLCLLVVDCPHATPKWTDSGVVVLRNQNIKGGRLDLSTPSFTDEENYRSRVKRATPKAGDLVITREAPMGDVCQIPQGLRCCLGQRQVLLRPDPAKIDARFLLFALQSPYIQHQIGWNEGTGSTVSNLRIPVLEALKIPTPSMSRQIEIASLLGAIDDRIALLRETNATLEAIAQALFKSWFVDFDPVYAKQQGLAPAGMDDATAALFPDNLEKWVQLIERPTAETLIGKRVLMIGDGYRAKNSELGIPGVPFVRGGDLLQGRITPTKDFLAMTALSGARGKAAKSGDTAFTSKGTIGRFAFVDSSAGEAVYSPQVCFWRSLNQDYLDPIYLHFWMKSLAFTSQVAAVCGQAAIMDFVSLSDQRKMILDIPLTALQARFANAVKPLLERISVNRATDECLSELRDTLLPRLISGQLRLPEAEEALAEAVA